MRGMYRRMVWTRICCGQETNKPHWTSTTYLKYRHFFNGANRDEYHPFDKHKKHNVICLCCTSRNPQNSKPIHTSGLLQPLTFLLMPNARNNGPGPFPSL